MRTHGKRRNEKGMEQAAPRHATTPVNAGSDPDAPPTTPYGASLAMIIRMRLRAGAAIPGRLSTHPLCPRSPGTGPSEQSTTQQQRRTRLPPAAPTTKSPAQDGISIESHPRSSTEPPKPKFSLVGGLIAFVYGGLVRF